MIKKANLHKYTAQDRSDKCHDIAEDVSKILRKDVKNDMFRIKLGVGVLVARKEVRVKSLLNNVVLFRETSKSGKQSEFTAYDVFRMYKEFFTVPDTCFFRKPGEKKLQLFHGFRYAGPPPPDGEKRIECFLTLARDLFGPVFYNYFIHWIASIYQNPGRKNGTALLLIGGQGSGKSALCENLFELFVGYSDANITDMTQLTKWNAHLEYEMLVLFDEKSDSRGPQESLFISSLLYSPSFFQLISGST
jgi:hypothetical protein